MGAARRSRSTIHAVSDGGDGKRNEIDPPRLLAARSEHGYVERLAVAMRDAPEAVSQSFQD